jgi:hypothetical protein
MQFSLVLPPLRPDIAYRIERRQAERVEVVRRQIQREIEARAAQRQKACGGCGFGGYQPGTHCVACGWPDHNGVAVPGVPTTAINQRSDPNPLHYRGADGMPAITPIEHRGYPGARILHVR